MKKLDLRPYLGSVWVCQSRKELRNAYEKRTGTAYPYTDAKDGGRFVRIDGKRDCDVIWLVYAGGPHQLAHEFAHVLLHTFRTIGHDPREGDGEPFCYMLSQLMLEAAS